MFTVVFLRIADNIRKQVYDMVCYAANSNAV